MRLRLLAPRARPLKRLNLPESVEQIFKKYLMKAQVIAKRNVTGGGSFAPSKSRLSVRSGTLRDSITWGYQRDGNTHRGVIGSNVVYARIHEEGGTIRPKRAKYLTIPLRHLKWSQGRERYQAKNYSAFTNAGRQRWGAGNLGVAQTFILNRHGRLYIMGKVGRGKIVPLFRLVKQVKIPKRPYLRPALTQIVPMVMNEIGRRIANDAAR